VHNLKHKKGDFAEAEKASETSLAIPIYPELSKEQQEFVIQKISEFYCREMKVVVKISFQKFFLSFLTVFS
jgi:dTDP-4-amino-4,6-dideoxygalactose transaminase